MASSRPLRIVIDLTPLLAHGQNGGVKPFIFEYVGWLGRQSIQAVHLVFLTRRATHEEARTLARPQDELICVLEDPGKEGRIRTRDHSPAERAWFDPPNDLVRRLEADLLYLPFGYCRFHYPGIPTIATVVDVLHRDYPHTLSPAEIAAREQVFNDIVQRADFVQGISQHTLDRLVFHYRFNRDRTFCSYIAIHERLRRIVPTASADASGRPYFFYPANAWEHKNHKTLLVAYGIYRHRAGDAAWDLVLTGHDDPAMRQVIALAETLGLGNAVRFMGHLPEAEFVNLWHHAGALVFPSLHEGFGIPLVEAMAFGLPIIASKAGSLPEVGADACLYVDALKPDDVAAALQRLATEPALRAELKHKAFTRLQEFSFEADARLFLEKLLACAAIVPRSITTGVHPDGWSDPQATIPLPALNLSSTVKMAFAPMPLARTLHISHDRHPIGTFHLPAGQRQSVQFPVLADGRMLHLAVPDASHLSPADHRCHGVHLESLALEGQSIEAINLLQRTP